MPRSLFGISWAAKVTAIIYTMLISWWGNLKPKAVAQTRIRTKILQCLIILFDDNHVCLYRRHDTHYCQILEKTSTRCGCANTVSKDRAFEKTPQVDIFPIGLKRKRMYKNNGQNKPPHRGQPSGVRKKSKTGPCQNNASFMYKKSEKVQSDRVQGWLLQVNFLHLSLPNSQSGCLKFSAGFGLPQNIRTCTTAEIEKLVPWATIACSKNQNCIETHWIWHKNECLVVPRAGHHSNPLGGSCLRPTCLSICPSFGEFMCSKTPVPVSSAVFILCYNMAGVLKSMLLQRI